MSEEVKILAFVAFGVECYKKRVELSGREVAELFRKYGVEAYLHDEYDVLHTMGEAELMDDIDRFIKVRS